VARSDGDNRNHGDNEEKSVDPQSHGILIGRQGTLLEHWPNTGTAREAAYDDHVLGHCPNCDERATVEADSAFAALPVGSISTPSWAAGTYDLRHRRKR
jgi:hypothetical protein